LIRHSANEYTGALVRLAFEWRSRNSEITINAIPHVGAVTNNLCFQKSLSLFYLVSKVVDNYIYYWHSDG